MTILKFNSPRVPFTDARGNISREWQIFLAGLYERASGADSMTLTELIAVVDGIIRGHVIEDEGAPLAQRSIMNFAGAGVTVTDAGGKTVVTIPGGGGGGGGSSYFPSGW